MGPPKGVLEDLQPPGVGPYPTVPPQEPAKLGSLTTEQ